MLHKSRRLKGKILIILQEGVLALAMRMGYWIILDELNLAPSDVLEALNRVLDDNRELFVPETQTLIKAHSSFRIFATQNPSGSSYGGRKFLSRAFRNRFELNIISWAGNRSACICSHRRMELLFFSIGISTSRDFPLRFHFQCFCAFWFNFSRRPDI